MCVCVCVHVSACLWGGQSTKLVLCKDACTSSHARFFALWHVFFSIHCISLSPPLFQKKKNQLLVSSKAHGW